MNAKKILFSALLMVFMNWSSGFTQINLLNTYAYSGTFVKLETEGYKFYLMDVPAGECRIYNTDFSLWKTVKLSVPSNNWLTDIQFLSQHLFNSDDKLEVLYVCYEYVETATSYYYIYTTRIAGENGQILLDVPGGAYSEIKTSSQNESRLMVYVWDYSVFPYTVQTRIYSIPGMLTGTGPLVRDPGLTGEILAFPNPSNGLVNIRIPGLAENEKTDLIILNDLGQVVYRHPVSAPVTGIDMEPAGLPAGTYYFRIEGPHYQTKPKKIVYTR